MVSIYCNINSYTLNHKVYLINAEDVVREIGSSITSELDEKLLFLSQEYDVNNIKLHGIGADVLAEEIYSLKQIFFLIMMGLFFINVLYFSINMLQW